MVDFDALPGQPKLFVIDGAKRENVETMMAVADRFEKTGTVRAIVAQQAGSIVTLEGTMRFGAGDYIVSDDPPTHAWPVRKDIFERTYRQIANAIGEPLELETQEPPVPTGEDAGLYQPDPATIRANPDNGPDFERVYDDSQQGWEDATGQPEPVEDVTGQADPLVEDVSGQPDIPPKRRGRGNRR